MQSFLLLSPSFLLPVQSSFLRMSEILLLETETSLLRSENFLLGAVEFLTVTLVVCKEQVDIAPQLRIENMADTRDSPAPRPGPDFPIARILPGLGSMTRWTVLKELAKSGPLPVAELARRLRMSDSAMSKQMAVLRRSGLAVNRFGSYTFPEGVLSPDGKTADYGCLVLRF